MFEKVKIITSYAAHARWHAEVCQAGYIVRHTEIQSPFSSGPTHTVYEYNRRPVIIVEVSHRRYVVFAVPQSVTIYQQQSQAEAAFARPQEAQQ